MAIGAGYGGSQYSALARDLQSAAIQFTALASSASAFGASLNSFRELERQLTLAGAAAGASAEQFRAMEAAAKRFSLATTTSATESAQALYFLASAGFTAKESLAAMTGVLLLAQATLKDTGEVSDILASNIQAFGLSASDATRVANLFTAASNASLASVDKLAYSLRQVAPVAKVAGLSIEETTAYLSTLYNVGLRGEQAGTGLRNIIVRLAAPVGVAKQILQEFNIATINADGSMRDLAEILKDVAARNFSEATLSKIFGQEALASAVALLHSVGGEYQGLLGRITDTNDAFEVASKQLDTLDGSLKLARNGINVLAQEMGEALAPAIRDIVLSFVDLVRSFSELDPATKQLIASLAGLLAVGISASTLIGTFGPSIARATLALVGAAAAMFRFVGALKAFTQLSVASGFVATLGAQFPILAAGATAAAGALTTAGVAFVSLFSAGTIPLIAAVAVSVIGIAAAWKQVADSSLAAKQQQEGALSVKNLIGDNFQSDLQKVVTQAQRQLQAIPFQFSTEGVGPSDAAGATLSVYQKLEDELKVVEDKRKELTAKVATALQDREAQQALIDEYVKTAPLVPRGRGGLGKITASEAQSRFDIISDFAKGQLAQYDKEIAQINADRAAIGAKQVAAQIQFNELVRAALKNIELEPSQLAGAVGAGPLADKVKALLGDKGVVGKITEAIKSAAADGKTSTQEIQDIIIKILGEQDQAIADALKASTGLAKTVASLEAGQKQLDLDLRKIRIAIQKRSAAINDNVVQALQADNETSALEFVDRLEEIQKKTDKIITDALGNFAPLQGIIPILKYKNEQVTANLQDIITFKSVYDQLEQAAQGGASSSQLKSLADALAKQNKIEFDALIDSFKDSINPETIEQLKKAYAQAGEGVALALEEFGTSLAENLKKQDERQRALVAAAKRQSELRKQLALLRIESQKTLLEAQQALAEFQQFDPGTELDRGLKIIDLQYQQNLVQIKTRIEEQATALGRNLTPDERAKITKFYEDAAQTNKEAAQQQLFRQLRETGREIQRELEDLSTSYANAARDAKKSILEKGTFISIDDFIKTSTGVDQSEILAKYTTQIQDLARQQEDLLEKYRGSPEKLAAIRNEYTALIAALKEAAAAELGYTVSFEQQVDRRKKAIDKQIAAIQSEAVLNGNAVDQLSAGINASILEFQKNAVTMFDIAKDAFSSFVDSTTSLFGDLIYDSGNALENFKKSMLSISRKVFESITKNFLTNILSGTSGGPGINLFKGVLGGDQKSTSIDQTSITALNAAVTSAMTAGLSPVPPNVATAVESGFAPGVQSIIASNNAVIAAVNALAAGVSTGSFSGASGIGGAGGDFITRHLDQFSATAKEAISNNFGFSQEVQNAISSAADQFGVSADILTKFAKIESGGNPNAKNASGAAGLFQFVPSTAKQYGLTNPFDPFKSAQAAAELLTDNFNQLSKSIGRAPTGGELYLAHQQGAGGAAGLINNPNALAKDIVGSKAVLSNGGTLDETAQQFAQQWIDKFNSLGGEAVDALKTNAISSMTEAGQQFQTILDSAAQTFGSSFNGELQTALQTIQQSYQNGVKPSDIVDPNLFREDPNIQALAVKAQQIGLTMDQFNAALNQELQAGAQKVGGAMDQAASTIKSSAASVQQNFQQVGDHFSGVTNTFNTQATNFNQGMGLNFNGLINGLAGIAQKFLGNLGPIFNAILSALQSFPGFGGGGGGGIGGLLGGLFGGGSGGGVSWGSAADLLGGFNFHTGGQIGSLLGGNGMSLMPAQLFANAPRYHRGGSIFDWLKPGDVPIIGKVGERVVTEAQWNKLNSQNDNYRYDPSINTKYARGGIDGHGGYAGNGNGVNSDGRAPVNVSMHVYGVTDADSFRRSEPQINKRLGKKLSASQDIA